MKIIYKIFISLLATIILLIGTFQHNFSKAESFTDTNSINAKLKEMLIPLNTTKADNGFEDLQPLKKILKDVNILGMGEATHGTKEFFQMKHRMYEFLVEEMGYRAFAIEAEFGIHKVINDYILNDSGTMEEVISVMKFWTWSTQEVADMIDWMKEYNQNPNNIEKIRFYGYDMQGVSSTVDNIYAYLEKVDPSSELLLELSSLYTPYDKLNVSSILKKLVNSFENNKDTYISLSSKEEFEMIRWDLEIVSQNLHYEEMSSPEGAENSNETFIKRFNFRDEKMAENVKWIHEFEKKNYKNDKLMLWAHNGHISNHFKGYSNMGGLLKEEYNNRYYSLGFDFYKGSLVAVGEINSVRELGIVELEEPTERIFSSYFKETGYPISFLDFKTASTDHEIRNWLSNEHSMHLIGSVLTEKGILSKVIPKEYYDGIINIEVTNAAESIYLNDLPKVQPIHIPANEGLNQIATQSSESEVKASTSIEGDKTKNSTSLIALVTTVFLILFSLILWRVKKNR
jgi:erythromycin esterase